MNSVTLIGRLTKDPVKRTSHGEKETTVTRYTLAVDRKFKKGSDSQTADFVSCVAFGKSAEFAAKYFHKGLKIAVAGRIQTGSFTNAEGIRIYTTDVVVEQQEFAESKNSSQTAARADGGTYVPDDEFTDIPEDTFDDLPFA